MTDVLGHHSFSQHYKMPLPSIMYTSHVCLYGCRSCNNKHMSAQVNLSWTKAHLHVPIIIPSHAPSCSCPTVVQDVLQDLQHTSCSESRISLMICATRRGKTKNIQATFWVTAGQRITMGHESVSSLRARRVDVFDGWAIWEGFVWSVSDAWIIYSTAP